MQNPHTQFIKELNNRINLYYYYKITNKYTTTQNTLLHFFDVMRIEKRKEKLGREALSVMWRPSRPAAAELRGHVLQHLGQAAESLTTSFWSLMIRNYNNHVWMEQRPGLVLLRLFETCLIFEIWRKWKKSVLEISLNENQRTNQDQRWHPDSCCFIGSKDDVV